MLIISVDAVGCAAAVCAPVTEILGQRCGPGTTTSSQMVYPRVRLQNALHSPGWQDSHLYEERNRPIPRAMPTTHWSIPGSSVHRRRGRTPWGYGLRSFLHRRSLGRFVSTIPHKQKKVVSGLTRTFCSAFR